MEDYIIFVTKGNSELLEEFFNSFVKSIRLKFEQGFDFINMCLDTFYKEIKEMDPEILKIMSPIKEIENYKMKLDELEDLKLKRLEQAIQQYKDTNEFDKIKQSIELKNLKKLDKIENIITRFPSYKKRKLNFMFQNQFLNKIKFTSKYLLF